MNMLQTILGGAAAKATGWALVHVLWQATLIAAILGLTLLALRNRSSNARYAASLVALCLTIALPIATGIASFEVIPPAPAIPAASPATDTVPVVEAGQSAAAPPPLSLTERISNLPIESLFPWVVGIWLLGVTFLSTRIAFGLTSISRMGRLGISPVPPSVERAMNELADAMGIQRAVTILRSRRIEVPTVIGLLEPVILVPASALSGLSPQQLRTILAHELAHIRRHDFAINLVQAAVETLLFFHPAVWWISRQVRIEREHCCDDVAVAMCGDPIDYARALATMEELRADMLPMVAASGGSLSGRIRRLLGIRGEETEAVKPAIAVIAALAVTMAAVLPLFAGSYIYDAVVTSSPGEQIVVIGDSSDEDIEDIIDAMVDAQVLAAGAREQAQEIKEQRLAELERVREEIGRAEHLSLGLKEEQLAELARIRAEVEVARSAKAVTATAAQMSAEARELASLFSSYSFEIAPVPPAPPAAPLAPLPPTPPTPAIAPAAPVAPLSVGDLAIADVPLVFDISTSLGSVNIRRSDEPLDPDNPTVDDLIILKSYGIDAKYIREMQAAGLKDLSVRELAILRSCDVSAATVKEMRSLFGDDLKPAMIGAMTSLGIDAAWIREMRDTGIEMTASEAIRMKSLGIDAARIKSLEKQFGRKVSPSDAVRLQSVGVDAKYVGELAGIGLDDLTPSQLVRLRRVGVDADFVKSMRAAGLSDLDANALMRLASVGADPAWITDMRAAGLRDLDANVLVRLKNMGIGSRYVSEIRGAGYPDVTVNELLRLKSMGIDASYIDSMNASRSEKLSIHDLIRLRSAGIDADYVKDWNERK